MPQKYKDVTTHTSNTATGKQLNDTLSHMGDQITQLNLAISERKHLSDVAHLIKYKVIEGDYERITIQGLLAHFNQTPE